MTFKTKAATVNPGNFALTTESMPFVFLAIVVLAVALTLGLYFAGKRGGRGNAPNDSGLQHPPPESSAGTAPAESPRVPDAHEPAPPRIPPPSMTVVQKVDAAELEDMEHEDRIPDSVTSLPQPPPPRMENRFEEGDILKVLSSLPRGLPSTLWGMDMEELAGEVSRAEQSRSPDGDLLIKVRNKWYYGDPKDIGNYLQKYVTDERRGKR
jgi:hypothetical protein